MASAPPVVVGIDLGTTHRQEAPSIALAALHKCVFSLSVVAQLSIAAVLN